MKHISKKLDCMANCNWSLSNLNLQFNFQSNLDSNLNCRLRFENLQLPCNQAFFIYVLYNYIPILAIKIAITEGGEVKHPIAQSQLDCNQN